MADSTPHSIRSHRRRAAVPAATATALLVLALTAAGAPSPQAPAAASPAGVEALFGLPPFSPAALLTHTALEGRDEQAASARRPTVEAAFERESYAPAETARLRFFSAAPGVSLQIVHAGTEARTARVNDEMGGDPVTPLRPLGAVGVGRVEAIRIGSWPSGLYFARLTAPGGRVGYAPFVLRPVRLGEHRIAVVLPTQTWQAYNYRDDDRDGRPDTWYGDPITSNAALARPFEDRGTPPHYRQYDQPFLRWLQTTRRQVDYLSDRDLNLTDAKTLARAYVLIVFEGHHEYVTTREYDVVTRYRDRGGNLMFLSANNFFYRVDIRDGVMTRVLRWRDVGRPEAALVGVQYVDWNQDRYGSRSYVARGASAVPWIFAGTGVADGRPFGTGGIEIDARTKATPPGTRLLASIPDVFGPGKTAEMTYYETTRGAKVFAAGAFSVAASIWQPPVRRLVGNLWARLGEP